MEAHVKLQSFEKISNDKHSTAVRGATQSPLKAQEKTNTPNPNEPRGPKGLKKQGETNPHGPQGPIDMQKQEETNPNEPRGTNDMKQQEQPNPSGLPWAQ